MRKLKVYLDTSVISYLSQEDAPERMKDTLELWKDFVNRKYDVYLSQVPSVDKGIHAPSAYFLRLAALTSIGVRPVRLIPLPCQPLKEGTWGPKEFCVSDL